MPLAYQALVPFAVLLTATGLTRLPALRPHRGAVASAATGLSAAIALFLLLRLKPTERVDLDYLRAFPGADLALRLDGLSLAFAVALLATATGLMLARLRTQGDRRDPWVGWLLTAAAALLVVMAGNLLLVYIALQVLTLAWSGALDEAAPRARRLRLAHQAGDVALLVAAASAIRTSGTSAFAGMPSDAVGPLVLLLLLVPVATRAAATVVLPPLPPRGIVAFVPAVAWVAPGSALLLRILSLAAGRPLDRPIQVAVYATALLAAAGLALYAASTEAWPRFATAMVAAQAAVLLALGILQNPLATVGAAWVSVQLILIAGLVSIQPPERSLARSITTLMLGLVPPSLAFIGVLCALAAFSGMRLLATAIPLGVVAALASLAMARHLPLPRLDFGWPDDAWAAIVLGLALIPAPFVWGLVLPIARTVRPIPAASFSVDWFGLAAGGWHWPVTLAGVVALAVAAALARLRTPVWSGLRLRLALPATPWRVRLPLSSAVPWLAVCWVVYGVLLAIAVQR